MMGWRGQVKREHEEIRDTFKEMNFSSFQSGDWFSSFVSRVLAHHVNTTAFDRIQRKYRGSVPAEQAKHAIDTAARYCAVAGGLTASLASAATVSVVPTFGMSFPGVGAAIGLAVMTDIGYCLRTHIRTTYDLSVIHGGPLTSDDVEDCYLVFMQAMDVNIEQIAGKLGKFFAPRNPRVVTYNARMIVRGGLREFFLQITSNGGGPQLVRKLIERVNLRILVPGVNVAMAGTFNRRFTRHVLHIADRHMRWRGAVVQPLLKLYELHPQLDPLWVLQGIVVVVESGTAAEWSRQQIDALRYCQSMLGLSDEDLSELDGWFEENVYSFTATLPDLRANMVGQFLELLVVVSAMFPDSRNDREFAQSIAYIAAALGKPAREEGVAQRIGHIRSSMAR